MKNWLIKSLGGYTAKEYAANRKAFDDAAALMLAEDRGHIVQSYEIINGATIHGTLIAAPFSSVISCYWRCYTSRTQCARSVLDD